MRLAVCITAALAVIVLSGRVFAAEETPVKQDTDQQYVDTQIPDQPDTDRPAAERQKSKQLGPFCGELRQLVRRYYPDATVVSYHDPKSKTDKIHFEFNTQFFIMRFRDENGEWKKRVPIHGPAVGGIWCDIELLKGRYRGKIPDAEEGYTGLRPEYYSRWVAPYSKKLDRHLMVTLRFPGGTPSGFLKRFDGLMKGFDGYVEKPAERESDAVKKSEAVEN
jgi:hypothetical protein